MTNTNSRNWYQRCPCGHLWLYHDIAEHVGDGSELCCVAGCDQQECPGRQQQATLEP